jgi:hypothetical protein
MKRTTVSSHSDEYSYRAAGIRILLFFLDNWERETVLVKVFVMDLVLACTRLFAVRRGRETDMSFLITRFIDT